VGITKIPSSFESVKNYVTQHNNVLFIRKFMEEHFQQLAFILSEKKYQNSIS